MTARRFWNHENETEAPRMILVCLSGNEKIRFAGGGDTDGSLPERGNPSGCFCFRIAVKKEESEKARRGELALSTGVGHWAHKPAYMNTNHDPRQSRGFFFGRASPNAAGCVLRPVRTLRRLHKPAARNARGFLHTKNPACACKYEPDELLYRSLPCASAF